MANDKQGTQHDPAFNLAEAQLRCDMEYHPGSLACLRTGIANPIERCKFEDISDEAMM